VQNLWERCFKKCRGIFLKFREIFTTIATGIFYFTS
jgi:hypothetical protein